jgi:hypothetical protein
MTRLICGKESVSPFVATTQPPASFFGASLLISIFLFHFYDRMNR